MDADNSFYVKFIATEAPTFFGIIILVLASVSCNRVLFPYYPSFLQHKMFVAEGVIDLLISVKDFNMVTR